MAKNDKTLEVDPSVEATSKIDAIKNLIFGENMAAYESEFQSLKKDLAVKKQDLEDFIDDTKKELHHAIDNLSTDINIRITDLEDKLSEKAATLDGKKVDKKTLGDLLINLGEKISQK